MARTRPQRGAGTFAQVAQLTDILAHLDTLLDPAAFADYGPNGLQVPGREEVTTLITGVSAGLDLFEQAIAADADAVLVHHGLFWRGAPLSLGRPARRRLQLLFDHDVSLIAYHLPLDAHVEHGNNALLAAALGCTTWTPLATGDGPPIGVAATFPGDGISADELIARTREAVGGREPLAFTRGPERIRSVGIVSGGGCGYLGDAIAAGLDAFITGEPVERVMNQAHESEIHVLAAGHYATETFGVRRLGELLAAEFGVAHTFIDVPNPI
jgi:dinuclear metal center YbgI/SA1388 family protein